MSPASTSLMNPKTFEWAWRLIISIFVGVGAWFGKEVWSGQTNIAAQMKDLQITTARSEGSRFTSIDWQREKSLIETRIGFLELKSSLSEQKIVDILKTVEKIDGKVSQWK